jgi:hypothetical protein
MEIVTARISAKDTTMQRITTIALFIVSSILGAGMASAQTYAVQATMPFNFTVANKVLPPGTYKIVPVTDGVVEIKSQDKQVSTLSATSPDTGADSDWLPSTQPENGGKLVFDKFGDQYFLRQVLGGAFALNALNVDLPSSKSEKRARTQEITVNNQTHALVAEPRQVVVAATQSN